MHTWILETGIGRLAYLISASAPLERSFVFLNSYFDESGDNADCPVYLLCGYVGTVEAWADFELRWKARILDAFQIPYSHAREMHSNEGPFADRDVWTFQRQQELEAEAGRVVCGSQILGFVIALGKEHFINYLHNPVWDAPALQGQFNIDPSLSTHYGVCIRYLLATFIRIFHIQQIRNGRFGSGQIKGTEFGFDAGNKDWIKSGLPAYEVMKKQWAQHMKDLGPGPTFGHWPLGNCLPLDDETTPPLQAADLLAYHTRRALVGLHNMLSAFLSNQDPEKTVYVPIHPGPLAALRMKALPSGFSFSPMGLRPTIDQT